MLCEDPTVWLILMAGSVLSLTLRMLFMDSRLMLLTMERRDLLLFLSMLPLQLLSGQNHFTSLLLHNQSSQLSELFLWELFHLSIQHML